MKITFGSWVCHDALTYRLFSIITDEMEVEACIGIDNEGADQYYYIEPREMHLKKEKEIIELWKQWFKNDSSDINDCVRKYEL